MEIIEAVKKRGQRIGFEVIDLFAHVFENFSSESFTTGILIGMPFQK